MQNLKVKWDEREKATYEAAVGMEKAWDAREMEWKECGTLAAWAAREKEWKETWAAREKAWAAQSCVDKWEETWRGAWGELEHSVTSLAMAAFAMLVLLCLDVLAMFTSVCTLVGNLGASE